jgi:hypothetical protein
MISMIGKISVHYGHVSELLGAGTLPHNTYAEREGACEYPALCG